VRIAKYACPSGFYVIFFLNCSGKGFSLKLKNVPKALRILETLLELKVLFNGYEYQKFLKIAS